MIESCKAFKATDKSTLKAEGLRCGVADDEEGFFLNDSEEPTLDCSECFGKDGESGNKKCQVCPENWRCTEDRGEEKKEAKCRKIGKGGLLSNCESYQKTDSADSDPKCQKCQVGFGVGEEKGACHNCCEENCYFKAKDEKTAQEGIAVTSINGGDSVKCVLTESKSRILKFAQTKDSRRLAAKAKAKIVSLKEEDKLPGCRQYKEVTKNKDDKSESQLKCQVCWKDFQLKDGECSLECDKKKSTASETCNYTDDNNETVTNRYYCLQEKEAATGLCMPVKKVDAECAVYKTGSEKDVSQFFPPKPSQFFAWEINLFSP